MQLSLLKFYRCVHGQWMAVLKLSTGLLLPVIRSMSKSHPNCLLPVFKITDEVFIELWKGNKTCFKWHFWSVRRNSDLIPYLNETVPFREVRVLHKVCQLQSQLMPQSVKRERKLINVTWSVLLPSFHLLIYITTSPSTVYLLSIYGLMFKESSNAGNGLQTYLLYIFISN